MQTYKLTVDKDKAICWYNEKNQLHRLDGPAYEYPVGYKAWYVDGQLHRLDGPAIEYANGSKSWWVKGKLHRLDGPAIERTNGDKEWWVEGELHRLDGPAIDWAWAGGRKAWAVEGKQLTEKEFNEYIKSKKL